QDAVDRRRAQASHVLIHHPPGQLPVPQLRVPAGVVEHRLLLLRQRLGWLHRPDRLRPRPPRPPPLPPPAVIHPPRPPPRRPPATPPPVLFHLLMRPLLRLRRQLPIIL